MRKTIVVLLAAICAVLIWFTSASAYKVFRADWRLPQTPLQESAEYRLVLITQELETPFWDKVGAGAREEAAKHGAMLEIWGSYNNDADEFLKKLEIAIHSRMDGIIVQGLDTDAFKELVKYKAASYGIPVITVANDVPDSLRRTYVGSDQFEAGRTIARQLAADMGQEGTVILLRDNGNAYYQEQRLDGIRSILEAYPGIELQYAETQGSREQVIAAMQDLMNHSPDVQAFIAANANLTAAMVQEIGRRSRVKPYHIYSFDDSPDTLTLLREGLIDGIIEQSPEEMGRISTALMIDWLEGRQIPLKTSGYHTEIRLRKAEDAP
ncbi:ABC-type sugar transport system, periplasmic component [Thermobacillus composti KWC4]|jgi:ribose transport system substrate-binding protein|uniref:ABC-type sugar transport system, periplasmic component n=1 Tax=Thermobacillus composti (strain DSM 18247 / JCM 13945 / KWC4) TaxID=717605 RepID=L0E9U5_THECK|nr:substrate-binding domain-containing protein [Thermobacillus composti]AGA57073.1 ABC-type sugar transport system, periplasmic component [Thermobacillus composti KWC4]